MKTLKHTQSTSVNGDGKPWKQYSSNADLQLTIYSSEAVGIGANLLRHMGVCIFPSISPHALLEFIQDSSHRLTWDRNVSSLEAVPVLEASTSRDDGRVVHHRRCFVGRSVTKKVGPIASRDFVDCNMVLTLEDGEACVAAGVGLTPEESFGVFPVTQSSVRGMNQESGWHFTKCGVGGVDCKVSYVIHTDLKGWFPAVVINNVIGGSYVSFFQDLKGALAARGDATARVSPTAAP